MVNIRVPESSNGSKFTLINGGSDSGSYMFLGRLCEGIGDEIFWVFIGIWNLIFVAFIVINIRSFCAHGSFSSTKVSSLYLFLVAHCNLSVWIWAAYFLLTYKICYPNTGCSSCARDVIIGGIFMGINVFFSILAAVANDRYYPDARMTPREWRDYLHHLEQARPKLCLALKAGYNSATGTWQRVQVPYEATQWVDHSPPNAFTFNPIQDGARGIQAQLFQIDLFVSPINSETESDLKLAATEAGIELAPGGGPVASTRLSEVMQEGFSAVVHPPQKVSRFVEPPGWRASDQPLFGVQPAARWPARNPAARYGTGVPFHKRPTLRSGNSLRVYVSRDGNLPLFTDFLLRIAWLLNICCASSVVMVVLNRLRAITVKIRVEKHFSGRHGEGWELPMAARAAAPTNVVAAAGLSLPTTPPMYSSVVPIPEEDEEGESSDGAGSGERLPTYDEAIAEDKL